MDSIGDWIIKNWIEILVTSIGIPAIFSFLKYVLNLRKIAHGIRNDVPSQAIIAPTTNTASAILNVYPSTIGQELPAGDKEKKIEYLRSKVSILFIDDDTKFRVITILRKAGWIQTKVIKDLKNLNEPHLLNANIIFVDIQGVGKLMEFPDQGLGLAAAIKERFPDKKVIIYSADAEGSRFHKAFRLADDQLPKNAVPYEFENIIDTMTIQLHQNGTL